MNTLLNYLAVLAVAALLLAPALYGTARERRIDRQLRGAAAGRSEARGADRARKAQKSSSRSTVPSTAT
ncbi:hypothetical protein [Streptomyces subrutilus]|uniref:Uncharacterized protein n=1 Tax=Streptomyces subrutilus TaxID=36818 RepID=A0A1E5PW22_9ACTN|nr:hypothetical protein [Streptomyces subrutilus]OEJ33660.1 hypothetical protein BGK67_22045 [Streptomyces subrutilus]